MTERVGSLSDSQIAAIVDRERTTWTEQFAGGMLPFDDAYWKVRKAGGTAAEAQQAGVAAILDAFTARLTEALAP